MMKILTRSLALLALCAISGQAGAAIVDAVVATVGKEVILRSDIIQEMAPLMQDAQASASQTDPEKVFRQVLDQAVERELLYREAQLSGMQVPDKAIEERAEKIIKRYDSRDAFMQMLEKAGQTMPDFRERLRKELMALSMSMNKHKEIEKEMSISESEVSQYYQDHKEEFSRPERVQTRRIFLDATAEPQVRKAAKARLEALREEIQLGADFGELAKKHSKGPEAESGGLIGWVKKGDLVEPLESAAFSLETGGVSPVLDTEFGVCILKAEAKEAAGMASFEEARSEIEPKLRAQSADERYKKWMTDLRKRSQVRLFDVE